MAERIRNEYCLRITGRVQARPEGTVNPDLRSGEIEIVCDEIEILNASVTPAFQLDDDNLSETTRLTHRVLDLRRPQMQNNLMLRYKVTMEVRKFLDANGFIDLPSEGELSGTGWNTIPSIASPSRTTKLKSPCGSVRAGARVGGVSHATW